LDSGQRDVQDKSWTPVALSYELKLMAVIASRKQLVVRTNVWATAAKLTFGLLLPNLSLDSCQTKDEFKQSENEKLVTVLELLSPVNLFKKTQCELRVKLNLIKSITYKKFSLTVIS
jgi:hypothetical protein